MPSPIAVSARLPPSCAQVIDHFFQIAGAFGKACAFGAHVGIVEAVIGRAKDAEHVEGTSAFSLASAMLSPNHGRRKVWPPNGSLPGQAKLCQ